MEALERALYEIEAKNFFEAENILRSVINNEQSLLNDQIKAYKILIDYRVSLGEQFESELNELVKLFKDNNKTNTAIDYLKDLYSDTSEIFVLDICDDIAFKFGHIGELKSIKLHKCKYFYNYKCSNRLNAELLVCSKLFKNEIQFKEYQILNSLLVLNIDEFKLLFRNFFKEYMLKTSLSKNDEVRQILSKIIFQAQEAFLDDDYLKMELYLTQVESELVKPNFEKIVRAIIMLVLIDSESDYIVQLSLMCLDRINSRVKFELFDYLKTIKGFEYQKEAKHNVRLRELVARINKELEKDEPMMATETRIKVKFISEDSLLIHPEEIVKPEKTNPSVVLKNLFEKIGEYETEENTERMEFELVQKLKSEGVASWTDRDLYDVVVLFLEMQFFSVAEFLLSLYDGDEKEYLMVEYFYRSESYFDAIDLINAYFVEGDLTPEEIVLYKYMKGECFFKLKKKSFALKEFEYVHRINPSYRMVKDRIDEVKKNQ